MILFREKKKAVASATAFSEVLLRKMGLEPTRCIHHKILSLARLPVPTLPHMILQRY